MNGVLPLWKPSGMTSHDCVNRLRTILNTKKIGHTGTLDPQAEGVLPLCIGQATKISSLLTSEKKTYQAEVSLGKSTDTEDQEGKTLEQKKVPDDLSVNQIDQVLSRFTGEITQIPPMYSAVKVKGKKLYEYAREGKTVERPARQVTIYSINRVTSLKRLDYFDVRFSIQVECSKGTYIRTLCADIGQALGLPAHMSRLVRIQAGSFSKNDAISFETIEQAKKEGHVESLLVSMDRALQSLDYMTVPQSKQKAFLHGQVLPMEGVHPDTDPFRIKSEDNQLLALYQKHPSKPGKMKPYRVFTN